MVAFLHALYDHYKYNNGVLIKGTLYIGYRDVKWQSIRGRSFLQFADGGLQVTGDR